MKKYICTFINISLNQILFVTACISANKYLIVIGKYWSWFIVIPWNNGGTNIKAKIFPWYVVGEVGLSWELKDFLDNHRNVKCKAFKPNEKPENNINWKIEEEKKQKNFKIEK